MARILVVEDEPGIAMGLEDSLRLEGYLVEVVANGARAGRRALEETFDLVLLDIMLPDKNGFDVCRDLRRAGFDAPIIFLTARTQESDRVEGLDLGGPLSTQQIATLQCCVFATPDNWKDRSTVAALCERRQCCNGRNRRRS